MSENMKKTEPDSTEKEFTVGGYKFYSEEVAAQAKDELNAIKYMTSKTNTKNPKQIYVLYNSILDKQLFNTQIGMNYLKQLQQFLYTSKHIPNDKIRPIPINNELSMTLEERRDRREHISELRELQRKNDTYKKRQNVLIITIILLIITMIGMVIITVYSKNANVINYEVNIQNKYAEWQEQLDAQEKSLKSQEASLEDALNNSK